MAAVVDRPPVVSDDRAGPIAGGTTIDHGVGAGFVGELVWAVPHGVAG
jgi:hypothetical protein